LSPLGNFAFIARDGPRLRDSRRVRSFNLVTDIVKRRSSAQAVLSRREALRRLGAGTLLTLGLWPGAAQTEKESAAFRFLVVNDAHYMSPECGAWLEKVVRQMNGHEGVEFCLFAGDLVEKGLEADLGTVREILRTLKVPVHVVVGNHDYLTQTDRSAFEKLFPGQLNYSFEHQGWQCVGLDTSEGLLYQNTTIPQATFQWLDEHLPKLDKQRPTMVFTHFPLGEGVRYRPKNAEALLERFLPFNLQAVFCGHFHAFTERRISKTTLTTNRCCALKRGNHDGTKEKGYFLCAAKNGKISREFVEVKTGV
jgi:predicted phosphodiesterase